MAPPAGFDPGTAIPRPGIAARWDTQRDELAGITSVIVEFGDGHRFPERAGLEFASDERFRFSARDDWATAETEGTVTCRVRWPGGPTVTAEGRLRIASSASAYDAEVTLDSTLDGASIFHRTWSERIPRDLA